MNYLAKTARRLARVTAVALCAGLAGQTVQAEITLEAIDGSFTMRGSLLGFDESGYSIRSSLGDFKVPAALVTCVGDDCPEIDPLGQEIVVAGPGGVLDALLPVVLTRFAETVEARATPAEGAAVELLNGTGDMLARFTPAKAAPQDAYSALSSETAQIALLPRGVGAQDGLSGAGEVIVAQDALTVIVSPDVGLETLTTTDLEAIFSAQVTNWSELGGPDLPIQAFRPSDDTGAAEPFSRVVLEPVFSEFSETVTQLGAFSDIAVSVSEGRGAIGLTSSTDIGNAQVVGIASSCGIVSYPHDFAIKSEDYPLTRRLYLYTKDSSPSRARGLADYLVSAAAGPVIETAGLTSLAAAQISLDDQGSRLAYALSSDSQRVELQNLVQFARETAQAQRLSTTFRFGSGSALLDDKGAGDIARLLDVLGAPGFAGREVMLIGFADSIGQSELNRVLSERRAEQVRDQIVAASGGAVSADRFRVLGFGAAAPVACNDTEFERGLNRRVEVWLK